MKFLVPKITAKQVISINGRGEKVSQTPETPSKECFLWIEHQYKENGGVGCHHCFDWRPFGNIQPVTKRGRVVYCQYDPTPYNISHHSIIEMTEEITKEKLFVRVVEKINMFSFSLQQLDQLIFAQKKRHGLGLGWLGESCGFCFVRASSGQVVPVRVNSSGAWSVVVEAISWGSEEGCDVYSGAPFILKEEF